MKIDSSSDNLIKEIRDKALIFKNSLSEKEDVDFELFETLMRDSWNHKKNMKGVVDEKIIILEKALEKIGFDWIKLLGAGGGGSFLCKPKNKKEFIDTLNKNKIQFNEFKIDNTGLKECRF